MFFVHEKTVSNDFMNKLRMALIQSFPLLMEDIRFLHLCMLKDTCISGMHPTYDPFSVLLNSVGSDLIKEFYMYVYLRHWPVVSLLVVCFSGFVVRVKVSS